MKFVLFIDSDLQVVSLQAELLKVRLCQGSRLALARALLRPLAVPRQSRSDDHPSLLVFSLTCPFFDGRFQVKYTHSIRIALELKKTLVDRDCLEISQANMEAVLFELIEKYNYGQSTVSLYRTMSRYFSRLPDTRRANTLVVFITVAFRSSS